MPDYAYHLATMERVAARSTKAELVKTCARFMFEADKNRERAYDSGHKEYEENVRLKNEVRNLNTIRSAVTTTLAVRSGLAMENPAQLSFLLEMDRYNISEASSEPEQILLQLLDNCDSMIEAFGGNGAPTYAELMDALDTAIADRNELLKKFGLTEMQWVMQGGESFMDLE